MELDDKALLRYSRHILLPELDIAGQTRLSQSRVLVVGAGGLGSPVALYLASSGVGTITLADHDAVELSNLQRQIAHTAAQLGQSKAVSAALQMHALNSDITIQVLPRRLMGADLDETVATQDLILDCTDNFATRQAINQACVAAGKPLITGAALRFSGQLLVTHSQHPASPCYHCLYPKAGEWEEARCATFGVLSPLVGVIGCLQSVEAIKWLVGLPVTLGQLTLYDGLHNHFTQIAVPRDTQCTVCGMLNV